MNWERSQAERVYIVLAAVQPVGTSPAEAKLGWGLMKRSLTTPRNIIMSAMESSASYTWKRDHCCMAELLSMGASM